MKNRNGEFLLAFYRRSTENNIKFYCLCPYTETPPIIASYGPSCIKDAPYDVITSGTCNIHMHWLYIDIVAFLAVQVSEHFYKYMCFYWKIFLKLCKFRCSNFTLSSFRYATQLTYYVWAKSEALTSECGWFMTLLWRNKCYNVLLDTFILLLSNQSQNKWQANDFPTVISQQWPHLSPNTFTT